MTIPNQILDFTNWKLTLPTGKAESPDEVSPSELKQGQVRKPYFWADSSDNSVVFRAPVNGVTTSGSGYPRSELREMLGGKGAAWTGTDSKYHTMVSELSFTAYPLGKPHVVGQQIHDTASDFTTLRLEGPNLYLTLGNNSHYKLIKNDYKLGDRIVWAFQVYRGKCNCYLNGKLVGTIDASKLTGGYFKAGAYTQANTSTKGIDKSGWGEVKLFQCKVTHGDTPAPITLSTSQPPPVDVLTPPVVPPSPPTPQPPGVPPVTHRAKRVLIVIRHAEKDDNKDGKDDTLHELSKAGRSRALKIRDAFQDPDWLAAKGLYKPDRLIVSKGSTKSLRPKQTLDPYQLATGLPMNTRYDFEAQEPEVGHWLAQRLDVTLVCGEHSALINMCKAFGVSAPKLPSSWPDARFDMIWKFESDDGNNWRFTQIPQLLMPGDSSKPI